MRSRGLAVVEATGFFLLAASVFFEAHLCESTFTLKPTISQAIDLAARDPRDTVLWPPRLSTNVAIFHADESTLIWAMLVLFLLSELLQAAAGFIFHVCHLTSSFL